MELIYQQIYKFKYVFLDNLRFSEQFLPFVAWYLKPDLRT